MVFNEERAADGLVPLRQRGAGKSKKYRWNAREPRFQGKIFPNGRQMGALHARLFGETLEIVDYSQEIDTNLKIICFPHPSRDTVAVFCSIRRKF